MFILHVYFFFDIWVQKIKRQKTNFFKKGENKHCAIILRTSLNSLDLCGPIYQYANKAYEVKCCVKQSDISCVHIQSADTPPSKEILTLLKMQFTDQIVPVQTDHIMKR